MFFSGKISNSVLAFLDSEGIRAGESIDSATDLPLEFLRDPTMWLEARKLEELLSWIEREWGTGTVQKAGHAAHDLCAWGVLDGVIKMMTRPEELLFQPDRLLSYFISPPPPFSLNSRTDTALTLTLPVSSAEYPFVTAYLSAALEDIPMYAGKPLASVSWQDFTFSVSFQNDQTALFEDSGAASNINPALLNKLVRNLEESQKNLEARNRELTAKNTELEERLQELQARPPTPGIEGALTEISDGLKTLSEQMKLPTHQLTQNILKLQDYFTRSQQLIILLIGQGRNTTQVQEAMRRVDWNFVSSQFGSLTQSVREDIQRLNQVARGLTGLSDGYAAHSSGEQEERVLSDLTDILNRALEPLTQPGSKKAVRLERHLIWDRQVSVYPKRLKRALSSLLSQSYEWVESGGTLRVSTRPQKGGVEIEVSQSGTKASPKGAAGEASRLFQGRDQIEAAITAHGGRFIFQGDARQGSTAIIQLPS